jgi:beta-1,4-mannosyl-glycoprotein beta-1,4-N-acetylglucosaminyltransferase
MKIYDCFQFFNELDLLEIRLELLYDHVDYFVISESNRTHSNELKELLFMNNKNKFKKYMDKIIHVYEDLPEKIYSYELKEPISEYNIEYNKIIEIYKLENEGGLKNFPTFARDYLQREFIKLGLTSCKDDDIILISDLDEIPNPSAVDKIRSEFLVDHCIMMDCHNFFINNICHTNWYGNYSVLYSRTKKNSLTNLRNLRYKFEKLFDSGWHLSYMGGSERIKTKIKSYAHQEYNNGYYLENIDENIKMNRDLFGRVNKTYKDKVQSYFFEKMQKVDIENYTYPKKMIDLVKNKFPYLIK